MEDILGILSGGGLVTVVRAHSVPKSMSGFADSISVIPEIEIKKGERRSYNKAGVHRCQTKEPHLILPPRPDATPYYNPVVRATSRWPPIHTCWSPIKAHALSLVSVISSRLLCMHVPSLASRDCKCYWRCIRQSCSSPQKCTKHSAGNRKIVKYLVGLGRIWIIRARSWWILVFHFHFQNSKLSS